MEQLNVIDAFSALSQPTRLTVFRLLIRFGPHGMKAGDIAKEVDVPQNTLSTHLGILVRGGLVTSRREGRSIIYTADMDGIRHLVLYLTRNCCEGNPEACGALIEEIIPSC